MRRGRIADTSDDNNNKSNRKKSNYNNNIKQLYLYLHMMIRSTSQQEKREVIATCGMNFVTHVNDASH